MGNLFPKANKTDPYSKIIDFCVKKRMFVMFLINNCIPYTEDHKLMEEIIKDNPSPKTITVYGYDDTWGIEGDLFEAETNCVKERNLG